MTMTVTMTVTMTMTMTLTMTRGRGRGRGRSLSRKFQKWVAPATLRSQGIRIERKLHYPDPQKINADSQPRAGVDVAYGTITSIGVETHRIKFPKKKKGLDVTLKQRGMLACLRLPLCSWSVTFWLWSVSPPFYFDKLGILLYTGKLCSGHGECECGQCKCSEDSDGQYSGR